MELILKTYSVKDEELFRKAVTCLKKSNINFWLANGALLGLIRDKKLIPWDRDIDFGVWSHEVTEEAILNAFNNKDFTASYINGSNSIKFYPADNKFGKIIEVTLYKRQGEFALYTGYASIGRLPQIQQQFGALLSDCVNGIECYDPSKGRRFYLIKKSLYCIMKSVNRPFQSERFNKQLLNFATFLKRLNATPVAYKHPSHFFDDLQQTRLLGVEVKIPKNLEAYLEEAYGKDWRIPKKWDNWYEMATPIISRDFH
jgi:hypothetical protein